LNKAVRGYGQGKKSAEKCSALIDRYQGFGTMTTTMLNEFVGRGFASTNVTRRGAGRDFMAINGAFLY
jgi:hypothetical protein